MNLNSIKAAAAALLVSVMPFWTVSCSEDTVVDVVREDGVYSYTMYLGDDWSGFGEETRASGHTWDDQDVLYLSFSNAGNVVAGKGTYDKSKNVWKITSSSNLVSLKDASCTCYYFRGDTKETESIVTVDGTTAIFGDATATYSFEGKEIYVKAAIKPLSWRLRFKGTEGQTLVVKGSSGISNQFDRKTGILSSATNVDDVELTVQKDGYTPYVYGRYNGPSSSAQLKIESNDFTYERTVSSSDLSLGKSGYFAIPTLANHNSWTVKAGDHEFVDLGLPSGTLWATCNIGANSPEELGDKYALGEVETKSEYTEDNYHYSFDDIFEFAYRSAGGGDAYCLKEDNDVASVKWGKGWSMPSLFEFIELDDWCSVEKIGEVVKYTSTINGNTVCFPMESYVLVNYAKVENNEDLINLLLHVCTGAFNGMDAKKENFTKIASQGFSIRPIHHTTPVIYPESMNLSLTSLNMTIGESIQLSVSVSPENASFQYGRWSSDNEDVVTVDENGLVTASGRGKATIGFWGPSFRPFYLRCSVEVLEYHEFVDLGLPSGLKWATCNVGANSPEEYGDYFAWGETEPKEEYTWETYKWCNGSYDSMTKYCTKSYHGTVDNKTVLDPEDDAATANWGGSWRMPTKAEQDELRVMCTWTWNGNKAGYDVKGPNGNSVFLPAAGYRYNGIRRYAGSYGFYWSSSLDTSYSSDAYFLNFFSGGCYWNNDDRYYGRTVRPVCQ